MKRTGLMLLVILFSTVIFAQQMMGPPPGECNFTGKNGIATIPFELENNHIIITAKLNGDNSVRLVLDTGFPAHGAILYKTDQIEALNLKYSGQAMIGGPGGELKPADILMGASLTFPGVEFTGLDVVAVPHDEISRKRFSYHDGVIGYSILSRFVVDLDFENKVMILTKPEDFQYKGKGEELKFELVGNMPVISCLPILQNGISEPVRMVIDLGATHALSLDIQEAKNIHPPKKHLKSFATGASGEFEIIRARIDKFQVGKFSFKNVLISFNNEDINPFPDSEEKGNLGMDILKRFHLTIDYKGNRIFLEPNKYYNDAFEANMSGFVYFRDKDKHLVVDRVHENAPAADSGLKVNEIITKIDGKEVAKISKNELTEMFQQEAKTLELTLKLNDKEIKKKIKLRRLI